MINLINSECLKAMKNMPDNCVDSIEILRKNRNE